VTHCDIQCFGLHYRSIILCFSLYVWKGQIKAEVLKSILTLIKADNRSVFGVLTVKNEKQYY